MEPPDSSLSLVAVDGQPLPLQPPPPSPQQHQQHMQRRLSALQQLSRDIERDVMDGLPLQASAAQHECEPLLEISRVPGDDAAIDVHVVHHFRAHFDKALPAPGDPASPLHPLPMRLPPAAGPSGLHVEELHGGADAELAAQLARAAGSSLAARTLASKIDYPSSSAASEATDTKSLSSLASGVGAVSLAPQPHHARTTSGGSSAGTPSCGEAHTWAHHVRACSSGQQEAAGWLGGAGEEQARHSRRPSGEQQALHSPGGFEIDPRDVLVGERIAIGGFAEVFIGRYQGTLVAIKLLTAVDELGQERFRREVQMLESVRHPNIVLFMGWCSQPHLAIVAEFMHRGSLFKLLRRGGDRPLDPRMQRSVAVSVARGMSYLHTRSPPLMHLDLKSPNILLDDRWRVKIADFGLSRVRSHTFVSGTGAGTPEWMAPEVLRSEGYDERADVYSYGVVLWETLTGQQPWEGMHPMQVVGAVGFQGRQLPPPPQNDPFLADLCRRCLVHDPRHRPFFPQIVKELEGHYSDSRSSSLGSQHALSEGHLVLESGDPSAPARPGDARQLPQPPAEPRMPTLPALKLPALNLPAGVRRRVPGSGLLGGGGGSGGLDARGSGGAYGLPDPSPFAPLPPAGPLRSAAAAARPSSVATGQRQHQAAAGAAAAGMASQLHHQLSLTIASPFAQLAPFGDDAEEAAAAGPAAVRPMAGSSGGGIPSRQASAVACHPDTLLTLQQHLEQSAASTRPGASLHRQPSGGDLKAAAAVAPTPDVHADAGAAAAQADSTSQRQSVPGGCAGKGSTLSTEPTSTSALAPPSFVSVADAATWRSLDAAHL